jgi:hypothetical protein
MKYHLKLLIYHRLTLSDIGQGITSYGPESAGDAKLTAFDIIAVLDAQLPVDSITIGNHASGSSWPGGLPPYSTVGTVGWSLPYLLRASWRYHIYLC